MAGRFRFSPRPNRAHEIDWREWGEAAFTEARDSRKPILLAITAVWCHWCHVMDETSYSRPEVIAFINHRFIPVRVDNDQRPDVNLRYNLGGWPTTAVLTPEGEIITGGTFIPPDVLLPFLRDAEALWREGGRAAAADSRARGRGEVRTAGDPFLRDVYDSTLAALRREFDRVHGGLRGAPKFPMPASLELAIEAYVTSGDGFWREFFCRTVRGMTRLGCLFDREEGGFFRYATRRDWRVPHYEKMLEDNALLLEVLTWAYFADGDECFRDLARRLVRFLDRVLYLPDSGCWGGSQDADEGYYLLPLDERRLQPAPFVDRIIYTEWNALAAGALLRYARAFGQQGYEDAALRALGFLRDRCHRAGEGMARFHDGEPRVWGLLADQVATGLAAISAYEVTGEGDWLDFSRELAGYCLGRLASPNGLFLDSPGGDLPAGAAAAYDIGANAGLARWFLRLAALVEEPVSAGGPGGTDGKYRRAALGVLGAGAGRARLLGAHAAGFALAAAEAMRPWTTVEVVGPAGDTEVEALVNAYFRGYRPGSVLRRAGDRGDEVAAYLCRNGSCQAPVTAVAELERTLAVPFTPGNPLP